jgi:hypothetical protein
VVRSALPAPLLDFGQGPSERTLRRSEQLAGARRLCMIVSRMSDARSVFAPGTPEVACMSGAAMHDGLRTLEEVVGTEAMMAARALLSAEQRAELDDATAMTWVRVTTGTALFDAAARVVGRDPEALVDDVTRRAIERTFKTVWRMLLRFTSVEALIRRTPMIYARARNVGSLTARMVKPGLAEISLTGWSDVSSRQLRVLGIGIQAAVQVAGRRDVTIAHSPTLEGWRFDLRWRE